jgi:hypothetical protein
LSRELLAPPIDALRDAEELFKQTVGGTAQAGGDPGSASAPSAAAT